MLKSTCCNIQVNKFQPKYTHVILMIFVFMSDARLDFIGFYITKILQTLLLLNHQITNMCASKLKVMSLTTMLNWTLYFAVTTKILCQIKCILQLCLKNKTNIKNSVYMCFMAWHLYS